jgi:hypothetical protein
MFSLQNEKSRLGPHPIVLHLCRIRLDPTMFEGSSHLPTNALQVMTRLVGEHESNEGNSFIFSPAIHRSGIDSSSIDVFDAPLPLSTRSTKDQPPAGTPTGRPASYATKRSRLD